ncbi:MAG: response regulator [Gammaproteobacteria bacterium]|jgi:signal transduction histidine kinase|nr:response regulator [Gammaproteobacteria bacterium]MBT3489085.1 response regulator [Gammaproteobacteria bacterium]MBT3719118.1 response regulator [Gammaproteobacteria bacterium]MBT3843548.1 response regulator [Gammaproteobacteria bacterium]MBT3892752.1 response regulator [Gammaproteobacteria bacterium]
MHFSLDKTPLLLSVTLILVVSVSVAITIFMLYQTSFEEQALRLREAAASHTRLMEAAAKDHQRHGGPDKTALHQFHDAKNNYATWSESGELSLAKMENNRIHFMMGSSDNEEKNKDEVAVLPLDGELAIPMQLALQGESGTIVAKDHRGVEVLAAYEPVTTLNYGMVTKVDMAEIQRPFIITGVIATIIGIFLTLIGVIIFQRLTQPLLQKLIHSEYEAKAASRAKDEFLATMSHELRTPLSVIIGNSEILLDEINRQRHQEMIRLIKTAGNNQLALVNGILDISKIESGKFKIEERPYVLSELLDDIKQMLSIKLTSETFFILEQKNEESFKLCGDAQRISQVLINLVGNAIKFTEKGEVRLETEVVNNNLQFTIVDTGIGMSPEIVDQLFQRFHQADNSISRRFGGTGLGLYISYSLAQLMGGDIEVTSQIGVGSTFHLKLPYRPSDVLVQRKPSSLPPDQQKKLLHGHVLVVEDTPEMQLLERRILEKLGITVTTAENGQEAVDLATSKSFDLILMDMQMPIMDGIEATRTIRKQGIETPIVPLTANIMQKHRDAFAVTGCDDFLAKPIDHTALLQVLYHYLEPG